MVGERKHMGQGETTRAAEQDTVMGLLCELDLMSWY